MYNIIMGLRNIEKIVEPENIPEPLAANTDIISDDLMNEYHDFHRVRNFQNRNLTANPEKFVAIRGSSKYLVSNNGDTVYDGGYREKKFHNIARISRNFKGKEVYVAKKGGNIFFVDGKGNRLHDAGYKQLEYKGDGYFKEMTAGYRFDGVNLERLL